MKVLVISCNTGGGHNSAGHAVEEQLKKEGIDVRFLDMFSLSGEKLSKKVSDCYIFSTRYPALFKAAYMAGSLISSPRHKSPVYYANKAYCKRLYRYLKENRFDVVVTSHLFPAEALTALKRSGRLDFKTVAVATDYTSIPFWEETELDKYIIPHPDLVEEFAMRGLPREKLYPLGIPVSGRFQCQISREEAREWIRANIFPQLDCGKRLYLIMSGSMGFGNSEKLISELLKRYEDHITVLTVCGTNEKLKDRLTGAFGANENVLITGFTKQVAICMKACDVLFTKPGGLSTTEAAVANVPLIHTAPIPGCETKNALFFSERGMSCSSSKVKEQITYAEKLCMDRNYRECQLEAQRANIPHNAAENIVRELMDTL